MAVNIGPKIGIDGEAEYRKQINKIIQQQKELTSEMKKVKSQFDKNDKSQENLTAQSEVLVKQIKNQSKKIEILTKACEDSEAQLDKLAEAAEKVENEFGKNSKEIKAAVRAFEEQEKAVSRSRTELNNANAVLNTMERQLSDLQTDLRKATSGSEDFSDALEDVEDAASKGGDGFTVMKGAAAGFVSNLAQEGIGAVGDFVQSIADLSEETEEYRTMQAKMAGSAESFGYSIEFAKGQYQEFYKYLGEDQMATNAITNLMGLQTSTESLKALTEASIGVWTAYGDSIPIESLTESINETTQVSKVTGVLADALNWAGISEDEVNTKLQGLVSTQERADYIAGILNDTYGTSKTKYDELTEGIQNAKDAEIEFKEKQAEVGEALEPVREAITRLKTKGLDVLQPAIEFVGGLFEDFGESANEAEEEIYNVIESSDELTKSLEDAGKEFEDSVKALEDTLKEMKDGKTSADTLVKALGDLEAKSKRTGTEQYRLEAIVTQLNALYPELGLSIDSATGAVNRSTEEIAKYIATAENTSQAAQAQSEAAAATQSLAEWEAKRSETMQANAAVTAQIIEQEAEVERLRALQEESTLSSTEAQKAWNEALKSGQGDLNALYQQTMNSGTTMTEYQGQVMSVAEAYALANQDLSELQSAEAAHLEQLAIQDARIAEAKTVIDDYNASVAGGSEAAAQASQSAVGYQDSIQANITKAGEAMTAFQGMTETQQQVALELQNAVSSMRENVSNAITSQMDMFTKFDASIDLTTEQLLENMNSQVDGVTAWKDNLAALSDTAINKNLLQHLMEMGPEGAGYVELFASMTTEQMDEANALWEESIDIKGMTGEWGEELTTIGAEAIASGMEGVNDAIKASGADSVMGLVEGVESALSEASKAGVQLGETTHEGLKTGLDSHSPSKKTEECGRDADEGLIRGIENNKYQVLQTARELGEELIRAIDDALGTGGGFSYLTQEDGRAVTLGIADGIMRSQYEAMRAIESVTREVVEISRRNLNGDSLYISGYNTAIGLANGIYSGRSAVVNAAADVAWSAVRAARDALDIHSPSREFLALGDNSSNAFAGGFMKNEKAVMQSVTDTLNASLQNAVSYMSNHRSYEALAEAFTGALGRMNPGTAQGAGGNVVIEGDTFMIDGKILAKGVEKWISGNQVGKARARGGR